MAVEKNRFWKLNKSNKKRITILTIFLISLLLITFTKNLDLSGNLRSDGQNYITEENLQLENLKSQDLSSSNIFSGIGAPWSVSQWANRTDYNLPVNFGNGTTDIIYMDLGSGWEGYQLNGTINELYDTRNWVNGTFHAGDDDGIPDANSNDQDKLLNWTFNKQNVGVTEVNPMSGNYFNNVTEDYLELRMDDSSTTNEWYDQYDRCWWESNFTLPRGRVIEGEISLAMFPETQYRPVGGSGDYGTHWSIQLILNEVVIDDKNLIWLENAEGFNQWVTLKLQLTNWLDDPAVFPVGEKNMSLRVQLIRNGGSLSYSYYGEYQQVFIDNVSLIVKAEVNATQIGLRMNDQPVSNIDWGKGTVGQVNTWTETPVEVKFNTTEDWPFEMGGYIINFTTDVNLFARKMSDDSDYIPNFAGTTFEVINDSSVEWECYARVSVPTGYEETNMTLIFPEDVNITWISNAEKPDTNILERDCDNSTLGFLKVFNFSETPDGFWRVKGISPNYCNDLNIYNNVTNSWALNNTFISGDYINITGKIEISGLVDISGYIENTKAKLHIKFPNGTIWAAENQIKQVNDTGWIYFDPIMIPSDVPNYEAGKYEAIITWNNSYSSFGINETGIIYKEFTVIHDSKLEPDQDIYFIESVFDEGIINIKVSYNDLEDNTAIENEQVYTNYTGINEFFSEISPGFYLYEFNASKAIAGNNTVTIFANSTYYLNKVIEIKIEVVKETLLTVDNDFITVPWNQNFTVRFNFTEKNNPGTGINVTDDISIDWLGEHHLIQPIEGQYELTCNTSAYDALTLQSFIISINPYKYEAQTKLIRVQITELTSYLKLFINGNQVNYSDTVQVEVIETINIIVYYRDNTTKAHLPNATVNLLGIGTLNETNNHYNLSLDACDLGQGISALTIFAQLTNYQPQSIQFFIEIFERETELVLIIDNIPYNDGDTIQVEFDDIINITVYYRDNETKNHLPNATITLLGVEEINETNNQYTIIIDANDLDLGITTLTIFAHLTNYQSQSINFFIEVFEKATELQLFVNDIKLNYSDSVQIEHDESVNITVYFRELTTEQHVSGATVNLLGIGNIDEINNQYTKIIDANDLDQGITALTVFAQLVKYQSQSFNFFIEVTEKATSFQLILNGEDNTLDPVFNLTIGTLLNITVKYTEQSGAYIPNATLQLVGEGILIYLTRIDSLEQHFIVLDSLNLKIGVNLYSIIARATNYEIQTINSIITINRIQTLINISSQISAEPGDDVSLSVFLDDIDFGNLVIDATVTYAWAYGQGELVDPDNDGIYEIVLENVPEGTYSITITAFAGDTYDFESKEITLVVVSPTTSPGADLSWLIYVLVGGIVGLVMIFTLYQTHFKYPPMVRKIRKLRKKVRKNKKTKPILIEGRESIIKTEFQNKIDATEIELKQVGEPIPKDKMKIVKKEIKYDIKKDE